MRNLVGLSLAMFVMLGSSVAYGQSVPDGQIKSEGISSYIFSPMAITTLLVLALIAQLVYWHYSKNMNRKQLVTSSPEPAQAQAAKKRYDKESMSKLLKASASVPGNQRSLEEAIRLSQLTQPVLPERTDDTDSESVSALEIAEVDLSDEDHEVAIESDTVNEASDAPAMVADNVIEVVEVEDAAVAEPETANPSTGD